VRVFFYLENRERTLDTALDKVMMSLTGFASEVEREKARQRTYDALLRKARARQVTGGRAFGYDNVNVLGPDGKRVHVVRAVNTVEAKVVERIYQMYASGAGITRIAKRLNAEGAAAPLPRRAARLRGWSPSSVREVLYRELYAGVILWGRSRKAIRAGAKVQQARDASEWVRVDAPELRIISEELWAVVQDRLKRNATARRSDGRLLRGAQLTRAESAYFLTSFGVCAKCGGALVTETRRHGSMGKRQLVHFYGCATNRRKGENVCANRTVLRHELLDLAVINSVVEILNERVLDGAIDRAIEKLRAGQEQHGDRRRQIERELSLLQGRIKRNMNRYTDSEEPVTSTPMIALWESVKVDGARKDALAAELERLERLSLAVPDTAGMKADLRRRIGHVSGLLTRRTPQARQMLRKLLAEPIRFEPIVASGRRGYRFTGVLTLEHLIAGEAVDTHLTVVAPTGFEPVFPSGNVFASTSYALGDGPLRRQRRDQTCARGRGHGVLPKKRRNALGARSKLLRAPV
jgi:site-specific DNA recombinase